MFNIERISCSIPEDSLSVFTCELQSDTSIEWFNSIITALTLLVAVITAIASTRVAHKANVRAEKAETRSLRVKLGNDLISEFDTFAGSPFFDDIPDDKSLLIATYPYRESLDDNKPDERILKSALEKAHQIAVGIQIYSLYHLTLWRRPMPKDAKFKLEFVAAQLGDAVRNVILGFQYSNNEKRKLELCKEFEETLERLADESAPLTDVGKTKD